MHTNPTFPEHLAGFALLETAPALTPPDHDFFESRNPPPEVPEATLIDVAPPRRGLLCRIDDWFLEEGRRELETHARIRDLERGVLYRY